MSDRYKVQVLLRGRAQAAEELLEHAEVQVLQLADRRRRTNAFA